MARRTTSTTLERRWVSLPDAADYAGITERTLWRWRARGIITVYRAGPKLLPVDLNEIDGLIKPTVSAKSA